MKHKLDAATEQKIETFAQAIKATFKGMVYVFAIVIMATALTGCSGQWVHISSPNGSKVERVEMPDGSLVIRAYSLPPTNTEAETDEELF